MIAGDGPDRTPLEGYAARIGIAARVAFRGYQSPAQVRELLRHTDVFALASFAEGVPVVATRIAGIPELVDDGGSGFLVTPGEPRALAESIAVLLDDAALRNRFGTAGRAQVEREFDIAATAERLCRMLEATTGMDRHSIERCHKP